MRLLRSCSGEHGAIAQLVERFHGMEEVRGSIPLSSTPVMSRDIGTCEPSGGRPFPDHLNLVPYFARVQDGFTRGPTPGWPAGP